MVEFSGLWQTRLGRRLVALIILTSAVLTVLASALQLYTAYERDRQRALNEFVTIDKSFRDGLERAIWEFNFPQINLLLDGILAQADVVYLTLETPTGDRWEMGEKTGENLALRRFELSYQGRPGETAAMGTLTAGISLKFVRARLWEQFLALVLSNFAKTFLASVAILVIFERVVARHLRKISSQIGQDWLDADDRIRVNRPPQSKPDEIDEIVTSLNQARADVRLAHADLADKLDELAALNAKLSDTTREQSEFSYALSHDLKSPTNTVRMLLDELQTIRGDQMVGDEREIFGDLELTVGRMGKLVEDVLAYSRSVGDEMEVTEVDLQAEVGHVLQDLASDLKAVAAPVAVGPLPVVEGNPVQLRLLLQNLISNAIKFQEPGRASEISVHQVAGAPPGFVRIDISDNGIGIDPDYHAQIFGLFKRLHTHSAYQGSGIGLAVCHRIVSNHGGRISVTSRLGEGSTFTVEIPETWDGRQDKNSDADR